MNNTPQDYTFKHLPFPSINQYRNTVKSVVDTAKHNNQEIPTLLLLRGTVKLHGTNAAVVLGLDGKLYPQSRERVLTLEHDNAGFAAFCTLHNDWFIEQCKLFEGLKSKDTDVVQIFGEWCGGNIQKGVGLSKVPRMFVIFGVRVSTTAEENKWLNMEDFNMISCNKLTDVFLISQFPIFYINIDFNTPEQYQNQLQEFTAEVERDCPVARALLPDSTEELIGEGIVWEVIADGNCPYNSMRFKVKGEKHSVSKVTGLVTIDMEKVNSVTEFVDATCTVNRLEQGLEKMHEQFKIVDQTKTGDFIRWIMADILKEDSELMVKSGLCTRDISSKIASKARTWFIAKL